MPFNIISGRIQSESVATLGQPDTLYDSEVAHYLNLMSNPYAHMMKLLPRTIYFEVLGRIQHQHQRHIYVQAHRIGAHPPS